VRVRVWVGGGVRSYPLHQGVRVGVSVSVSVRVRARRSGSM